MKELALLFTLILMLSLQANALKPLNDFGMNKPHLLFHLGERRIKVVAPDQLPPETKGIALRQRRPRLVEFGAHARRQMTSPVRKSVIRSIVSYSLIQFDQVTGQPGTL